MSLNSIDDDSGSVRLSGAWSKVSQSGAYWDGVSSTEQNGATMRFTFGRGSIGVYGTVPPCPNVRGFPQISAQGSVNGGSSSTTSITCNLSTRYGVRLFQAGPFNSDSNELVLTNIGVAPLQVDRIDYAEMDQNGQTPAVPAGNPVPPPGAGPGDGGTGTFAARPPAQPAPTSSPTTSPTPPAQQAPSSGSSAQSTSPSSAATSAPVSSATTTGSASSSITGVASSAGQQSITSTPSPSVSLIPGSVILTTINGVATSISVPPTLTTLDIYGNGPPGPTIYGRTSGSKASSLIPLIVGIIAGSLVLLGLVTLLLRYRRRRSREQKNSLEAGTVEPYDKKTPLPINSDSKGSLITPSASSSDNSHSLSPSMAAAAQLKASIFPSEKLQGVYGSTGIVPTRQGLVQESQPTYSPISLPEYRFSRIGARTPDVAARASSILRNSQLLDHPPVYTQ
ncbi:hypothetical protein CVT24_011946 [Panaeolus cyanescens]|uniref:Uncharacterized protein n=1 Tax=Panaeolus cyanescens TaxID=181874 RepID=A0A409W5Y4_9AGAR|nr:hypothetical protein CVT24_011946 [Panaeolus cyanescens]